MQQSTSTDKEGYLTDLDSWSPAVASQIAAASNVSLSAAHWEIIEVLREFYRRTDTAPDMRPFVHLIRERCGRDKGNSIYLMQLFGSSPAKMAAKIAGLPKPTHCL
ncbi:MAG TPA: sulfurtransferase TusE [Gammaproteobacteria bacterium]|nr:sulfurtransferase TusE [Gammaproteobacteria bacterium]|tara:strand:+ start:9656 stop:9973 length:318 start_codon:yes stop_codon:yes gene_type:complete